MKGAATSSDGAAVLDAIEEEVVPLYYARKASGVSPEWVRRCKHAMASVIPRFNMRRTVRDYAAGLYRPAAGACREAAGTALAAGASVRWQPGRSACASSGTA